LFNIVIQLFLVLELFYLKFEVVGNVGGLVGFVELIKSCMQNFVSLSTTRSVFFDKANPEGFHQSAISEVKVRVEARTTVEEVVCIGIRGRRSNPGLIWVCGKQLELVW
jgi:hypothetical protein